MGPQAKETVMNPKILLVASLVLTVTLPLAARVAVRLS